MYNLTKFLVQNFYKYKRKQLWHSVLPFNQVRTSATNIAKNGNKLRILFFGTDNFSLPSLDALHRWKSQRPSFGNSLGVVTSFKNPANCVRLYATRQSLPLYRWPVTQDIAGQYDLGVVVSFGHLIPEKVISSFPLGMINVHASLLPRWRGAAPIIYALMHGDRSTGVSIMRIEPKRFDVGDILAQEEVLIKDNIFMPELHNQLAYKGANILVNVLDNFPLSFQNPKRQNSEEATYASKVSPVITQVSWTKQTAHELFRLYRALYGFKHLNTRFQARSVQLVELGLPTSATLKTPLTEGGILYNRERNCLVVGCASGTEIEVHQLRLEGKKVMNATDFNNGFLKKLKPSIRSFDFCS